ncbi:MAG: M20/M25/M40 family metallo-hydrolase [Saprospiraceae bacterium]|nr:M20/M25/M40 family metallo-hydrolase [Saprospiraceae bacterium]
MKKTVFSIALLVGCFFAANAQDKPDEAINKIIRKHGLEQSKVMETAFYLTDVYGPRLTGSPMLDKATNWAQEQLKAWGLDQVHTEAWGPFGRGWELKHFEMHAVAPNYYPILAYPKAWSPSTKGLVSGEVIYLDADSLPQLAQYKGKLRGKFVLTDTSRVTKEWFEAPAERLNSEDLLKMANAPAPTPRTMRNFGRDDNDFTTKLRELLYDEKPLALLDRSFKGDLGTVFVSGARSKEGSARDEGAEVLPQATLSVEHYNRIFRLLKAGISVKLSMDLSAAYTNPDGMEHNIIAEIPGTDLKDEVVMFGAHLDSWQSATGATDNAAGSAVMMETARILMETIKESGVRPRRTLRIALWTGEEQGLLGSIAYVNQHFAEVKGRTVQSLKPEQSKISAYYNLDNGTGKIRGIYLQGNEQTRAIFRPWLDAFKDLEATTITISNTGGTDHQAFDAAGIPGFQFIQDPVAYSTRTHHSNMDNWDHLVADDLKQAATIMASFVWHTSQRDELLPRKKLDLGEGKKEAGGGN